MQGDTAAAQAKRAGGRKTVQNDGRRCGDRSQSRRNSLIYIGLTFMRKSLYPHKATFKRMDFSNPLTNKRIKRSPYSFPGSAISVFLLCKIPSERANLIFFSINSLLKHLPIYIMIRLFRQKTTLFFGNPYTTNLF